MWISFALIASVFAAINRLLIKRVAHNHDDVTVVFARNLFALLPVLVLFPFMDIPEIKPPFFYAAPTATVVDVFAIMFLARALRFSSMGQTVPLLSFTPVILLLTGFLILGEWPSPSGLAGILVIVIASYWLGERRRGMTLFEPFRRLLADPGPRWMLATAACFAVAGPLFKKAILNSSPFFCLTATLPISLLLLSLWQIARGHSWRKLLPARGSVVSVALLGFSTFGVAYTTNLAFEDGLSSYVVSIKRLSILFSVILGALLLGEKGFWRNAAAAVMMILGACLIAFGNG